MGRTNELRKVIQGRLKTVCDQVYYEIADNDKVYPHIVFSFSDIGTGEGVRDDVMLMVDIWDRSTKAAVVEDMADDIEDLFRSCNLPQESILPTFYLVDRKTVPDEDKQIRHRLIRILVQNYEREGRRCLNIKEQEN